MKRMEKLYLQYVIRSPALFFGVLILVLAVFFLLGAITELDVVQTYDGSLSGSRIILNTLLPETPKSVYIYKNRGEKLLKLRITKAEQEDGQYTILYFPENMEADAACFDGRIKLDVRIGKSNLLRIMMGLDRKTIPEEYHV